MNKSLWALIAAILLSNVALAQEGTVTVVTSFSKDVTDPIKAAFEAENPDIDILWRRESTGTLTARIAARVTPGVKTVVVPNGVEASRFTALEHTPQSPPLILSVGALKRRKGQLELVRALPAVRQQFPHVQAVLVGSTTAEPAYTARIEQTIRELGLQDIVHLAGHVPDAALLDYYRKATLFVLPSMNEGWKFEGFGLVHLEASAAALPVIGTRDCGAEDAIDDHHTGLLVSQTAIAAELPPAIITLLTDPAQAAAMGAAGRARALRQTWSHVAAQMHDVYNQHINEGQSASG